MPQPRVTVVFPAITFALIGACLSAILLVQHAQAARGDCHDCSAAFASRWAVFPPASASESVSVPVALAGMMYFIGLTLWMLVVGQLSWTQRLWHSLPTAIVLLGGMASLALTAEMVQTATWCPLCLAVHVINLVLIPYVFLCRPAAPADGEFDAQHPDVRPAFSATALVLCGSAAIWFAWDSYQARMGTSRVKADVASTLEPVNEVAISPDEPVTAPSSLMWLINSEATNPESIILFTDLQSRACRTFEQQLLEVIVPKFQGRVRLAWRQSSAAGSNAACLAEAARLQGGSAAFLRVWQAMPPDHTPEWNEDEIILLAVESGLNPQKLLEDWHSAAVRNRIADDTAEAQQLGIAETPTVFVNGSRIDAALSALPEFWDELAARGMRTAAGPDAIPHPVAKPAAANSQPVDDTPASRIAVGDELDIAGPLLEGMHFDLRDHPGQPTLVIFWTTESRSMVLVPELLRLHRKYHEMGLQCVGVSGDDDSAFVRAFVESNQLRWPQIDFAEESDRGRDNPLARRYEVRRYPAVFLVDGDGRVTATDLRGEQIEQAVAAAFGLQTTPIAIARRERAEIAATLHRVPVPPPQMAAVSEQSVPIPHEATSAYQSVPMPTLALALLKRYDMNGDGILQKSEFTRMPGDFARFDTNADDELSTDELAAAIEAVRQAKVGSRD